MDAEYEFLRRTFKFKTNVVGREELAAVGFGAAADDTLLRAHQEHRVIGGIEVKARPGMARQQCLFGCLPSFVDEKPL